MEANRQDRNLQKTVTLSLVITQTVISFQASLSAAMVTRELFSGFRLLNCVALSIRRFNGGQPFMVLRDGIFKRRVCYLHVLTVLLTFATIASQFTSTGLVTDLDLVPLFGDLVPGQSIYFINFTRIGLIEDYEPDYTTHMPSIYPAFAEYEEPLTKLMKQV